MSCGRPGLVVLVLVGGVLLSVACAASAGGSPTPGPAAVTEVTPTTFPPKPASTSAPTAGAPASVGKSVFSQHCPTCHGEQGQGVTAPANIGPKANLEKFQTAEGLYMYVSTLMPQDQPGQLSADEYLQVVTYLLVENRFVQPETILNRDALGSIPLKH